MKERHTKAGREKHELDSNQHKRFAGSKMNHRYSGTKQGLLVSLGSEDGYEVCFFTMRNSCVSIRRNFILRPVGSTVITSPLSKITKLDEGAVL